MLYLITTYSVSGGTRSSHRDNLCSMLSLTPMKKNCVKFNYDTSGQPSKDIVSPLLSKTYCCRGKANYLWRYMKWRSQFDIGNMSTSLALLLSDITNIDIADTLTWQIDNNEHEISVLSVLSHEIPIEF